MAKTIGWRALLISSLVVLLVNLFSRVHHVPGNPGNWPKIKLYYIKVSVEKKAFLSYLAFISFTVWTVDHCVFTCCLSVWLGRFTRHTWYSFLLLTYSPGILCGFYHTNQGILAGAWSHATTTGYCILHIIVYIIFLLFSVSGSIWVAIISLFGICFWYIFLFKIYICCCIIFTVEMWQQK